MEQGQCAQAEALFLIRAVMSEATDLANTDHRRRNSDRGCPRQNRPHKPNKESRWQWLKDRDQATPKQNHPAGHGDVQ